MSRIVQYTIAIDFDGTCVFHEYPAVGDDIPGAVKTLRELVAHGHKLILDTMRAGERLSDAEAWFRRHEIELFAVAKHSDQHLWTKSPKAYAHKSIDDRNVGCPLRCDVEGPRLRPYVDWRALRKLLVESLMLPPQRVRQGPKSRE